MLEESIDAIPRNLNRSIRQNLKRRKCKTTNLNILEAMESEKCEFTEMASSQAFYSFWGPENDENVQKRKCSDPIPTVKPFERFKDVIMLAAADLNECPIVRNTHEPTQMFQTCERLLGTQQNLNETENYLSCEDDAKDCFNVQTESMFKSLHHDENAAKQRLDEAIKPTFVSPSNENNNIDFFDDDSNSIFLEDNFLIQQRPAVQANETKKSIVDQILDDFCASLSSSSDDETKSVVFEPFFRFRKKRIRTYERCFRRRSAEILNKTLIAPRDIEDNELSDTSSELSVQEAKTQIIPVVEPLVINKTGAVHCNLLNLSAFFTQNLVEDNVYKIDADNAISPSSPASITDDESNLTTIFDKIDKPEASNESSIGEFNNGLTPENKIKSSQRIYVGAQDQTANIAPEQSSVKCKLGPICSSVAAPSDIDEEKSQEAFKTPTTKLELSQRKLLESQIAVDDILKEFEQSHNKGINNFNIKQTDKNAETYDFNNIILSEWPLDKPESIDEIVIVEKKHKNESVEYNHGNMKTISSVDTEIVNDNIVDELFELKDFWNESFTQLEKQQDDVSAGKQASAERNDKNLVKEVHNSNSQTNISFEPSTSKQAANWRYQTNLNSSSAPKSTSSIYTNDKKSSDSFEGFFTASSKKIHISEAARLKAEQIFAQLPEFPKDIGARQESANLESFGNKRLKSIISVEPKQPPQPQLNNASNNVTNANSELSELSAMHTSKGEILKLNVEKDNRSDQSSEHHQNETSKTSTTENRKFLGFQTASCKPIIISEKAKRKYQNFFDEVLKEDDCNPLEQPSKETETNNLLKTHSEDELRNIQLNGCLYKNNLIATTKQSPMSGSFHTQNSSSEQQFKAKESQKHKDLQNKDTSATKSCKFIGFETASSKPIVISEKAQQKYQNFFDEILKEENCNVLEPPAETPKTIKCQPAVINEDNFANIQLSEWLPSINSPKQQQHISERLSEGTPTAMPSTKRKLRSLENTDSDTLEQPNKVLRKSYTMEDLSTQTPKNDNLKRTLSHQPTTFAEIAIDSATKALTPGLIVRKNLLSLTKRRRAKLKESHLQNNSNINNNDIGNVVTPVKLVPAAKMPVHLTSSTQQTPKASEFYANLPNAASTPQTQPETPNRLLRSVDNYDSDFKRINWEQLDDGKSSILATTPTRTDSSSLNGTLKPVPSPQERIENLSACGDPPPLPHIVTSTRSGHRSLGLSRRYRKSLQKH